MRLYGVPSGLGIPRRRRATPPGYERRSRRPRWFWPVLSFLIGQVEFFRTGIRFPPTTEAVGFSLNSVIAVVLLVVILSLDAEAAESTSSGEVHCTYVGPRGGMHVAEPPGAVAIWCSDGSRTSLIDPAQVNDDVPFPVSTLFDLFDVSSTWFAISKAGLSEANPIMRPFTESNLGYVAMFAIKVGVLANARRQPPAQCQRSLRISNGLKATAGCSNTALGIAALAGSSISGGVSLGVAALICGWPAWYYTADSAAAECAEGVPSFLLTTRAQRRFEDLFSNWRGD